MKIAIIILIGLFMNVNLQAKENTLIKNFYHHHNLNKKYNVENKNNLIDFGAVGDGKTDDSNAFLKAVEVVSKTRNKSLVIPGNYIFNLNHKKIDFEKYGSDILLEFQGGILANANLRGLRTRIKADREKIFDNITLSGKFVSVTDYAYPEWYGAFPDDFRVDLVDALQKLNPVFADISLGSGDYYTRKGEFMVQGLKGVSMAKSRVFLNTEKSNTFVFSLGKVGGSLQERNYDYNYIRDLTIVIQSQKNIRIKGNRGIIVGAAHKPLIENVRIKIDSNGLKLSKTDLQQFVSNINKMEEANVGLEFNGDSEVTTVSNFFTMSDIGILFSTFCDFVTIRDYMSWTGQYGLASVYYRSKALKSQNVLFTGAQSWCQGLFGLYTENTTDFNSFPNVRFENLRIEQLVSDVTSNNKLQGANIWIGENDHIANLQFENIMFGGTSNGLHIGSTNHGRVSLENIVTWTDPKIKKSFALDINYKTENSPMLVFFKNVSLMSDVESYINNANLINNSYTQKNVYDEKNRFSDNTIVGKNISLQKMNVENVETTNIQQKANR